MQQRNEWFQRQTPAPLRRLKQPSSSTEVFKRSTGGRHLFGQVSLSALPCNEFIYSSRVKWPDPRVELCEDCVMDGILKVLLFEDSYPVLGAHVTLEEIAWHEVDSCALAYKMAAEQAMRSILRASGYEAT